MVLITCDIAVVAVNNPARKVAERISDRGSATILGDGTFHLIGSRCCSPDKAFREVNVSVVLAIHRTYCWFRLKASIPTATTRIMPVAIFFVLEGAPKRSSPLATLPITKAPRIA
jgi:hypothetical protein